MEHTVAGAIKEWRKHNKVIGQVKISYKKFLRKCRELSLAGGKYREYQGLCAKYQCARLTAVTKGLVPFEDKPFKAYLNKRLSKRRKLDIAHGSLNFIEKTFHPDVLPQLYNVADFGREMFSIPLKNGDKLDVKLLASPFQEEGELMLQLFLGDRRVYSVCFSCTDDGRAYIGGIQGGKDITNDEVKVLTKELHGARPKNIIMSVLYGFLRYFSITTLCPALTCPLPRSSETIKLGTATPKIPAARPSRICTGTIIAGASLDAASAARMGMISSASRMHRQ